MSEQPYQVMPALDADQRHALLQSIRANGVLEPVVVDEDGNILDGHHRAEIAEELCVEYPSRVLSGLDEAGKLRYAITTNAVRRQLAPAQVSSMIAHLRIKGMSIRGIADMTGVPKSTVARQVDQLSQLGQLEQPERVTSLDGRERPATRPATPTPGPSDSAITPPVGPGTTEATPASATAGAPAANGESPGSFAAPGAGAQPERPAPPPGSPATWTPEQREANRIDVQTRQIREAARRHAKTIVTAVLGEVATIVSGVDLGEDDLITEEMVAGLQRAVDHLASRLKVHA
jgi:ParB-like chromosome segregation protein Spo0J